MNFLLHPKDPHLPETHATLKDNSCINKCVCVCVSSRDGGVYMSTQMCMCVCVCVYIHKRNTPMLLRSLC